MKQYLYETHLHTCQASACGRSKGSEHVRYYKELGYQGIIITDHFFGGNTAVPRVMPWEERVDWFCSGYEDALAQGQKSGLDVFFGWEQGYGDDEYLIYGLDKAWLLHHPEVERWTRREQLENVHRYGGCVIQAHPFRTRGYIQHVRLGLDYADGCEVANAGNQPYNDAAAYRYVKEYGLLMTAGSDNHDSPSSMQNPDEIFGIALDRPLSSIHDLVRIIRQKGEIGLRVPPSRFELHPETDPAIESNWLDENEQLVPTGRDWLKE